MYGCESWTIKKAEHQVDAFELWCWRRLLRISWAARRSNQSILKGINCEYSLQGLMLNLNLQYIGHLMQRTDSLEKTLMLERLKVGKEGDGRGWDGWMASPTRWTWVWVSSGSWWWTGRPGMLQYMESQRVRYDPVTELKLNWEPDILEYEVSWAIRGILFSSAAQSCLILYLLAEQGTLKSLLHYHSSKSSTFQCSTFFLVQLSHPY